jgi:ribulose-phosphate 3-epimerase
MPPWPPIDASKKYGDVMLVAPSVLSADFGNLERDVKAICEAGCDLVHVDVMDGHFVPNLTIGPVVVSAIAKAASKPLDIHLMVENNTFFVDLFAPFKPRYISFHIEEEKNPHRLIQYIRSLGISPAIVLNPHTPAEAVEYLLPSVDMVLVMSVNPGFGGQSFIPEVVEKIKRLKVLCERINPKCLIEIDGGVNDVNIEMLRDAGVDVCVAGSYVFKHAEGLKRAIDSLKI